MSRLIILALEFMKIGTFAIGGGPATIPYLMELARNRDWFTMAELTDMIAISESTPGPIGINMATYVGYKSAGVLGGVVSTLSLVLPSIIIITLIAKFLDGFSENKYVCYAFKGLRPAVSGVMAVAVYELCKASLVLLTDGVSLLATKSVILAIVIFVALQIREVKKLHPAIMLLAGAICGVIFKM